MTRETPRDNESGGRFSPEYYDYEPESEESEEEEELEDQLSDLFNSFGRLGSLNFRIPGIHNPFISPRTLFRTIDEEDDEEEEDEGTVSYLSTKTYASTIGRDGRPTVIEKTKTTRKAPGISEVQKSFRDSRSGIERMKVKRTMGDKGRTLIRERTSSGRETSQENLHNLGEREAEDFDRDWCHKAERSLIHPSPLFLGGIDDNTFEEEEEYVMSSNSSAVVPRSSSRSSSSRSSRPTSRQRPVYRTSPRYLQ